MASSGGFIHNADYLVSISCTDTYSTLRRHLIDIMKDSSFSTKRYRIGTLYIKVDSISGSPTGITVRLCRDASGDETIVGDTTASISLGVTTPTEGSITVKIDSAYSNTDTNLYLFFKTNGAGSTCTIRKIELTSEE